ncbi:hypothetical protein Brms1b_005022 [Colletotrichum noveboracense]|nr:hypothetical protein COL940_005699 [Colletotrichum noveboracense]KAJ0286780.1 hypothetical protein CBS470a_005731 [Colletotrichum nupharicola]KAJ0317176.1 hypothetical protein Brms1b_005022 [Colletotrichum noveboracense]
MVFPILPKTPLPSLSLSAAGLVALADLQTIAHRTALTGTSSWWDSLVLAPGLHYQQAADGVAGSDASGISAETSRAFDGGNANSGGGKGVLGTEALPGGGFKNVRVTNPGMLLFLSRLGVQDQRARAKELRMRRKAAGGGGVEAFGAGAGKEDKVIVVDIGTLGTGRRRRKGRAFEERDGEWEFEKGRWGLAAIIALITSRLLNIYIIKQRTPPSPSAPSSPSSSKLTEYLIPLSPTLSVRMRGRAADLAALTTETYLLAKTAAQGYLEAAAKLTIYLVAVFSGNVSQAGNMALLVLLLGSAGLLGLSNGFMKGVKGKGRVARVWNGGDGGGEGPRTATVGSGGGTALPGRRRDFDAFVQGQRPPRRETEDAVEWGSQQSQVGTVVRDPYPFEGSVEYI